MNAISVSEWSNYLLAQAGVAATLTGLVFVAVSINLSRIISIAGLTGRAVESMTQLFGVVVITTNLLIPRQPAVAVGTEMLVVVFLLWLVQIRIQVRYVRSKTGHPRRWIVTRMVWTHLSTVPFIISGLLLLRGSDAAFYWLVPGCIFSLISGLSSAWVLLVEILR